MVQFLEFFLRCAGIGLHALQGRLDFAPTLGCEFFAGAMKLVGRFAPGFHLGGCLKLKGRLLLLDLLAEAVDIFLNLRLEGAPLRFQLSLCFDPTGLVGCRLLLDGVPEVITLFELDQRELG